MDGQANVKRLPCVGINLRYALPPAERGAESNNQANGTGNDGRRYSIHGQRCAAITRQGPAVRAGAVAVRRRGAGAAVAERHAGGLRGQRAVPGHHPEEAQGACCAAFTLGLGKKTVSYSVAPSVRIRTAQNLFIVYGRMPQLKGSFVGLKSDNNGQVKQIWELTEKEALDYVRRPDARFPQ